MASHQTAKTQYVVTPEGVKFAYRRLGATTGTPLLFLNHFRPTMDHWDPLLVNSIMGTRNIILYDYRGFGQSTGEVAGTFRDMADDVIRFLGLIEVKEVDILGFSIGGMVTQLVGLNADPNVLKVRKLILAGTGPSGGPENVLSPNNDGVVEHSMVENMDQSHMRILFFPMSREGEHAAEAYWARVHERSVATSGEEHSEFLSHGFSDNGRGINTLRGALEKFFTPETSQGLDGSYNRLADLKMPILVANGHDDYMLPTINSFIIQQKVPNGQLIVYPHSGHGFLSQYATQFAQDILRFLQA